MIRTVDEFVVNARIRHLFQFVIVGKHFDIPLFRYCRKKHPLGIRKLDCHMFFNFVVHFHDSPRMRHPRRYPHKHWSAHFLGKFKAETGHIVCLLLIGRLQNRYEREFSIKSRILFILRRVHRRIVGRYHEHASVSSGNAGIDKSVGSDVHSHMFHADNRPPSHVRHSESGFHGSLFISTPFAVHSVFPGFLIALDKFGNLSGRRARISINTGYT